MDPCTQLCLWVKINRKLFGYIKYFPYVCIEQLNKPIMTTQESNKMIAEFMGARPITFREGTKGHTFWNEAGVEGRSGSFPNGSTNYFNYETEGYHISWDWLMPVIEKIEMLGYTIEKNYQPIDKDWQFLIVKGNDILYQQFNNLSLKAAYDCIVNFIQDQK